MVLNTRQRALLHAWGGLRYAPIGGARSGIVGAAGGDAIPDGAVSRWKFNDDSDTTTAIDSVGANDGAITGATYTSDAQEGSLALDFDGVDDYVNVPNDSSLQYGTLSVSAWFKKRSGGGINPMLADHGTSSSTGWNLIFYDSAGAGELASEIYVGGTRYTVTWQDPTDGTWYFATMTYDGSALKLYIDGSEVASNTNMSGNIDTPTTDLRIGERANGSDSLDGISDDPILFDNALTSTEVNDLYNSY